MRRGARSSLLLLCCVAACGVARPASPQAVAPRPARRAPERRGAGAGTVTVRFEWEDANTEKVVAQEDDTLVIDPDAMPTRLEVTAEIDLARLRSVREMFGVPQAWLKISYRGETERSQKEAEQRRLVRTRGFWMDGDTVRVDNRWVVEQSRGDMLPVVEDLKELAEEHDYRDSRGFLGVLTSFVQGLEYRIPEAFRRAPDGSRVLTGGVTMPLETLYNGSGDCDTRSLLLASMLANLRGAGVIFLEGNDHIFAGLRTTPREYDRYVTVQGISYVLVELTSPWPIGRIPDERWTGVRRNLFRVIPVL